MRLKFVFVELAVSQRRFIKADTILCLLFFFLLLLRLKRLTHQQASQHAPVPSGEKKGNGRVRFTRSSRIEAALMLM